MIFITGDTHRKLDIKKLEVENFPEQNLLTRDDHLIITGDFGGVWTGDSSDDEILQWHENKPYTTLFIGGNHENYDALNAFPVTQWNGGQVHKIREHVIHLMNGEIFDIGGRSFFVMGGATSVDKVFRTEHETWWSEEEPSEETYQMALERLAARDYHVDYILTHTVPETVRREAFKPMRDYLMYESRVEKFLDTVLSKVTYEKWFTGHIHINRELPDYKIKILYDNIIAV